MQIPNTQSPLSPESDHSHDSLDSFSTSLVDGKKTYSCLASNCGKVFKFKSEIKRHVIIHCKERPFECTFPGCKKTFKRADALGNHIKLHERPSPYDCPVPGCKVQLNTKAGLQYHLSKHGEQEEEIYRCNVPGCNQTFLTYKHLSHHERSTHFAAANNVPTGVLTLKRPPQMMVAPAQMENNGFEAFMYGNKKMAVQSYLAPNPAPVMKYSSPIKYEEDSSEGLTMKTESDSNVKAEYSEGLAQAQVQVQPAFVQAAPSFNFEDSMKSILMNTLAENQKLKKEYMMTMKILQGSMGNNPARRNQASVSSIYKSLMEPLSI